MTTDSYIKVLQDHFGTMEDLRVNAFAIIFQQDGFRCVEHKS